MKKIILALLVFLYPFKLLAQYEITDPILGLKYEVNSVERMTGSLIGTTSKDISGELIIPPTFTYNGHDFSVTRIEKECFRDCKKLTSVTIPSTVDYLGWGCFYDCEALESITLSNNIRTIGECCFISCYSLNSISLPPSLVNIGLSAFSNCYSLKNVIIEDADTDYSPTDFTRISDLFTHAEAVYLGRRVTFSSECIESPTIKVLILGGNVNSWTPFNSLYTFKFSGMESLEVLECRALVPPSIPSATDDQYMNLTVYVPKESLELYKKADIWKSFWNLKGISSAETSPVLPDDDNKINVYTLQGIKLDITNKEDLYILAPGLYIVNGKKVLLK